jgi:hypothetical protein
MDVPGTECLDGSPTGIVYRCLPATGAGGPLIIHVDSGGACWDHDTCLCGPDTGGVPGFDSGCLPNLQTNHFGPDDVFGYVDQSFQSAVFAGPTSAFNGWNQVFLPYCTGDIHSGQVNRDFGDFTAHFKGYTNMTLELASVARLFPNPSRVAELGDSAGAYGVDCNLSQFAATWPHTRKYEMAISEVPWAAGYLPGLPAAEATWGAIHWNGAEYLADTCPFVPSLDYQYYNIEIYNRTTFPEIRKGLVAFYSDAILAYFACLLGAKPDGNGSCAHAVAESLMSAVENAILEPSGAVDPTYKTFLANGTCHDDLGDSDPACAFDSISTQGVKLNDWIRGWMEVPGFDWPMLAR